MNVTNYVNNKENPKGHRLGLMTEWNRGLTTKGIYRIPPPKDLVVKDAPTFTPGFDFSGYDSDEDATTNIKDAIEKNKLKEITLERNKSAKRKHDQIKAPVMPLAAALRIARQMVKRGLKEHRMYLPIIVEVGGHYIEFDTPFGNDIYAYGLKEKGGNYKRSGSNKDFSWKILATNLDVSAKTQEERATKKRKIFHTFKGEMPDKVTSEVAEAIGAIGCDFLKGMGNYHFVEKALKTDDSSFTEMFSGDKPHYKPAVSEGRKLATQKTAKLRKKRQALGYQPTDAQSNYLRLNGKVIHWINPDGRCIFGSLAYFKHITTEAAIQAARLAVQDGSPNVMDIIDAAAEQLNQSSGATRIEIFRAINGNRWSCPRVGDYIIHIAAAALGIGVTILMPNGNLVPINGGGALVVKVTNPLEHYHATQ